MAKIKSFLLPFFTLTFLIFLFFRPFFLNHLIPVPLDIITGMYYPWLEHRFGLTTSVPVKNPLLSDTISQFWLWRNWAIDQIKLGFSPFWQPNALAGYPLSSWFHTVLFNPGNIFYFLTDKATSMGLIVISQLAIGLFSTYFLLAKLTKNVFASLFGSISYIYSAYFIGWLTWGTVSWSLSFLPLSLLFQYQIFYQKLYSPYLLGLFLSFFLSILGGHPQTIFYHFLISLIFIIFHLKSYLKPALFTLATLTLAIFSAAFVLLPSIPIILGSIRSAENYISAHNYGFIPITKLLLTLISPNYFGNPATGNYWGEDFNFQEKLSWFGTAPFVFSLAFIINHFRSPKRPKIHSFIIFIYFLGVILAVKNPLSSLIYILKIPFVSTSSAGRSLILTVISGAILASLYFSSLWHKITASKRRHLLALSLVLVLPLLISFGYSLLIFRTTSLSFLPANILIAIRNSLIPIGILISIVFLSLLPTKLHRPIILIILLFTIIDGLYFGQKYTPFTDPDYLFPPSPAINFLIDKQSQSSDFFRIERETSSLMPPNMWLAYDLATVSGYDPIFPQSYANYLINHRISSRPSRYFEPGNPNQFPYIQNLGIKYFLALKRLPNGQISPQGTPPDWLPGSFQEVFSDNSISVLENKSFYPPYFFTQPSAFTKINLVAHTPASWQFRLSTPSNNQFVLLENNSPGWKAYIDHLPSPLSDYEGTFKAVNVPSGDHSLIFTYNPPLLNIGILVSLSSLIPLIILLFLTSKLPVPTSSRHQ